MVTIVTHASAKLNMDWLSFYSILDLAKHTMKSTLYGAYGLGGYDTELRGTGFKYTDDTPTAGTVTSITFYQSFNKAFTVTGISAAMTTIIKLAKTGYTTDDTAFFTALLKGNDIISGGGNVDRLFGYAGNDTLSGNGGNDIVNGGSGIDSLSGGDGNDALYGSSGNDKIVGGKGRDSLYGETGADTFAFKLATDSVSKYGIDTIKDFSHSQGDKIDLYAIDANILRDGNQTFQFIGSSAFTGKPTQLRVVENDGNAYIYGDRDGNKVADFQIVVENAHLVAGDFIL